MRILVLCPMNQDELQSTINSIIDEFSGNSDYGIFSSALAAWAGQKSKPEDMDFYTILFSVLFELQNNKENYKNLVFNAHTKHQVTIGAMVKSYEYDLIIGYQTAKVDAQEELILYAYPNIDEIVSLYKTKDVDIEFNDIQELLEYLGGISDE